MIYFYLVERRPTTYDIREQWPIFDLDRTLELCFQLGVSHQYNGPYPEPFTIDFLITESSNGEVKYRAASIKTATDAANPAVRLRLAVELTWCREKGIPWTLVDTTSFDKTMLENLRFMRAWFVNRYQPDTDQAEQFSKQFYKSYSRNVLLSELIERTAAHLHWNDEFSQDVFRYCAWTDRIGVSLKSPLSLDRPLVLSPAK